MRAVITLLQKEIIRFNQMKRDAHDQGLPQLEEDAKELVKQCREAIIILMSKKNG